MRKIKLILSVLFVSIIFSCFSLDSISAESTNTNIEQKEYTAMIIEQADRLTNLVDRLLGPNQLPVMKLQNIHIVIEKIFQLTKL